MSASASFTHRIASPADEAAVLSLMRDFYAEEHLVFDELIARRAVQELLGEPRLGSILLFELNTACVGYAVATFGFSLEFHGRYTLLDELYLKPPVRGHGYGRRALELCTEFARAAGTACLRLEVNHANARARAVYLKHGFRDDQRDLFTQWLNPPAGSSEK